jgi:hypothetical protein
MSKPIKRPYEAYCWTDDAAQTQRARKRAGAAMKRKARLNALLRKPDAKPDRPR